MKTFSWEHLNGLFIIIFNKQNLNRLVATETWAVPKANHFHKGDFSSNLVLMNLSEFDHV